MLWWEWLRRLKWRATGLDASVLFCSASRGSGPPISPCFAYVEFLAKRAGYAMDDICGDASEMVCDFDGSIGS